MKLYIIRHGETAWNKKFLLQGQTDIPLNENGRELAQVTARALQMVPFDLCITSPLLRAKETAQIILGSRKIPFLEDARIQEIGFGTYEGRRVRDENGVLVDPVFQISGMEGSRRTVPSQQSNFYHAQRKTKKQMPIAGQS